MDNISKIQDYVAEHHKPYEDPIPTKSRDRVTRQLAEDLKQVNPLKGGRCNFCGKEDEKLSPIVMKSCEPCVNRFIRKGGELKIVTVEIADYRCDYCATRTFKPTTINPRLCQHCGLSLGRTHRYEMPAAQKEVKQEREYQEKQGYRRQL